LIVKTLNKYSHLGLVLSVTAGAVLAVLLFAQSVRTYLYVGRVLVPQEAERAVERLGGALVSAARGAGILDPRELGPLMERAANEGSDRVVWMRLLNQESAILAQAGTPQGTANVPQRWRELVEQHDTLGRLVDTPGGKTWVTMIAFRMPRPQGAERPASQPAPTTSGQRASPGERRAAALVLEVAIRLDAVSGGFSELRQNLILGALASLALLAAMALIGFRTPRYLRGKYLEKELDLARRVQSALLPKSVSVSPHLEFAAAAIAADQVGGDFLDIFEADAGRLSLVLGDVSGKGMSSALLASVVQGAIRSSSGSQHETSCERINRMLCEKTASERFVTLFWGVFDPATATLCYVNAGHAAPLLLRANSVPGSAPERLDEGGPVLGVLPNAQFRCGRRQVAAGDTLIVYSDGINEAEDQTEEQFGNDRVLTIASETPVSAPERICERIMSQVAGFSKPGSPQDDRTLMVVRFLQPQPVIAA
jgi:serine phosphatase RsbU (regulator of sigma subunit)